MYISRQLKESNIAEYLIYMWQVEDQIRATDLDIDKIRHNIIDKYSIDDAQKKQLEDWYAGLIDMMRMEGVEKSGHLQINNNVIIQLNDLHASLLASTKEPFYKAAYFKTLPYIVELRAKSNKKDESEIETCFEALYGLLMLKLQKKEISTGTAKAMEQVSSFVSMLANYYNKDRKGELKIED